MSIPSVLERGAKTPQTPAREDLELQWYRTVYRGDDVPQLTLRAVLMGAGLGMFMSLSNLYVGLKTGWGLGVAITACILSFAIWRTLMTVLPRVFRTPMTILENNCMQSTASSAGYATGATLVSAIPACLLITGHHLSWPVLMFWTLSVGSLGVFMAIPMKRQMINVEQLRFPSGIAAAETLKSLHSTGADAVHKARALGIGGLFGALIAWLRDAGKPFAIPSSLPFPGGIGGFPLTTWTINFELSAVMIAAGAIMGWKVAWSLLAGATINYAVLAPWMAGLGVIDTAKLGYREIVRWSTWTGASIMVSSALLMFAFQWRTVGRALGGITATLRKKVPTVHDPLRRIEVPGWWFLAGSTLSGVGCLAVLFFAFSASIYLGIFAVALTFLLSVVVCRATG
jgi:putative OPT family oligopeptide transporter